MNNLNYAVGPIHAMAALTVDFGLPGSLPLDQLPAAIERDRMHMAKRPGLRQKHLPFRIDSQNGNYLSGGRYLFDTVENAEKYKSWAESEFVLDGIKFFERPFFIDPVCHVWRVIGAQDLTDIRTTHNVIRSERWQLQSEHAPDLEQAWPLIYQEAQKQGLSSVWLLHNVQERLAGIISIAGQAASTDLQKPEDTCLGALESLPSLGTMFDGLGWVKVFDRTSWVLTIWFPISEGELEAPALWPNSPPLPAPIGDK
jgi:hypothetical protein